MRSPAWLDNWPAGLTIEIKYLPCPLEPPAAVAFPRLRQPSPFPGLFNGYVVRRVVRPACCIIRGLTRIPAHIPARSVLKRLSLAITTVANTRDLLQGFILTYVASGARPGALRPPPRARPRRATPRPPTRRAAAALPGSTCRRRRAPAAAGPHAYPARCAGKRGVGGASAAAQMSRDQPMAHGFVCHIPVPSPLPDSESARPPG